MSKDKPNSDNGARSRRSLLGAVEGPQDLHGLSDEELQRLAQEVREYIIDTVGEIGGHFGANLGTCELAVALHSLLDSPRDKILWDVGHQAYPHKVLTGRRDRLDTIRQYGGLAPFCSIAESPHDIIGAGHASTSVGYAVGIKEGMRHLGRAGGDRVGGDSHPNGKVVAVIGDGAMTGGVAFEAIGQAGGLGTPIVVVLNDNGMSISPNVGALSRYFNRVRLNPKLWHAREGVEGGLARLPGAVGAAFEKLGPQLKESLKAFWAPGLWWEELDWAYMGVIDGHDVRALREALREALAAGRPVVVHIATVKGKGFAPAEDGGLEGMEKWHAAKPKSILNGSPTPTPAPAAPQASSASPAAAGGQAAKAPAGVARPQYTQVFGEALVRECERDRRVVGITAAMNSGTGLNILQKALPERYFDVGIAEQQAILFAAGLALEGVKPVAAIYSTFLQRAYDQIVHDVCLQKLNVVFAMDRAGLVGDDGPTHHGVFDIAYLRCLPNIVLMAPRDEAMLVHMLRTALLYDEGPIALRYPRGEGIGVPLPAEPRAIAIGTGEILREAGTGARPLRPAVAGAPGAFAASEREPADGATQGGAEGANIPSIPLAHAGRRVALVGYGSGVGKALEAATLLEGRGVGVTVADARFAKPIDAGLMAQLAAEHDLLVTIEEGVLAGGFGSAVWETLSEMGLTPRILRVGLPDRYVTHGKPALLHEEVGFTGAKIAERVAAAILDRDSAAVGA
ncbi:MAG TPA: 1-deoxy-D-xylulose-5-phosphate synthase [Solirubrobacteraceae bacterium]|jgi:1-deoxy-D-xylulose-5-phosphate synthase|nr:1-deoxy-D-xylulose-5-phosphate synthase [Solirubrobacteraceae bacterium]